MSTRPYLLRTEDLQLAPPVDDTLPRNAFTVDVEDWYQSCVDYDAPISERVVRNMDRMLAILNDCGAKGTFFVQGRVAEAYPSLVRLLVQEGHEVQSHGYSHRPLYAMNPTELRDELERGKKTIEDASGTAVTAFRAGDFAIGPDNLRALETLADLGFHVDSSIFPMRSRHYGIADWKLEPHHLLLESGRRMLELPVAIWAPGRFRIPVSGGGYVRLLPYAVIARGIRSIESDVRPAILYCHPYEFNSNELGEFPDIPRRLRYSQGIGRRSLPEKMRKLLTRFRFGTLHEVISAWSLG